MKKTILTITIPVLFAACSLAALLWFFLHSN
jgi:hypothetical protein